MSNLQQSRPDSMKIVEHIILDKSSLVPTTDGYLAAMPRVARTGIQIYRGYELGVADMEFVRVYRPEEEVFKADSLRTFAVRPVTDDHPPEAVTADNWKKYAVGQTGEDVVRDGDFIRVPMVLMDKGIIDKVHSGKAELSVGYEAQLKWGDGVAPNGDKYDAIQSNIRANHVAVVEVARGGAKLRIGDQPTHKENESMTTVTNKQIIVDGVPLEMSEIAAGVVQRAVQVLTDKASGLETQLKTAQDQVAKLTTDLAAANDTHKKSVETKDAEIVTLKKQLDDSKLTPAQIDTLVKDRGIAIAKAKAKIGDKLVVDGKSLSEIYAQVVTAKIGDAAKGWSEDQIKASFDTLTADVDLSKLGGNGATGIADAIHAAGGNLGGGDKAVVEAGYTKYNDKLTNAWKGGAAA